MKNSYVGLLLLTMLIFISCQEEEVLPDSEFQNEVTLRGGKPNDNGGGKGNGKGKGGKDDNNDDDTGEEDPVIEYGDTYQLHERDDYDQLYRFSFTVEGDQVLFQTDSTITSWGTDYWGYWAEPHPYENGVVQYISGLSFVKYEFVEVGDGVFDVSKMFVQGFYNSTHTDTTFSHPGLYTRIE